MSGTDNNSQSEEDRTSGLAEASIVLGVLSIFSAFCTGGIGAVLAMAAFISGVLALIQIQIYRRRLEGKTLAIAGMITAGVGLSLSWLFGVQHHQRVYELANRVVCGANLSKLGKTLQIYADDSGRRSYPAADRWCDLLLRYNELEEKQRVDKRWFICKAAASEGDKGSCHYAINPNCKPNSPPDTVLLFEIKAGWNQHGGPEILTTENHKGKGCNILFNDGSVRFVKTSEIGKLKWEVEEGKK